MPLTHEELQLLKKRRPGWEQVWASLSGEILQRLREVTPTLEVDWPDEDTREEFVCRMMFHYECRATSGALLAGYYCECTDSADDRCGRQAIAYLTGYKFLLDRARAFLRSEAPWYQAGAGTWTGSQRRPPTEKFKQLMEEISRELESLTVDLQANKEMLQVFETAGIQLYPRLNWSRLGRLRARLLEAIPAPASPWKDCFDLLSDLHRRAEEQFTAQMNNVVARIWNKGKGVGPREDLRLRNMLDDLDFRRRFLPLSAAAMKELLRIEKGDAAQRRSRYRKELPDLLPRLGDFYSELGDFGQFDDSLMFDQYEDEA